MSFDLDGLLDLWSGPITAGPDAEAAFRRLYTDPVVVNGLELPVAALVERAALLQHTFESMEREILDVAHAGDKVAVAFRLSGRHVGPIATGAGAVPATGRQLSIRVVDLLTLTDGRISSLWMAADELGALSAVGAVQLAGAAATG